MFNSVPELVFVTGNTLAEKVRNTRRARWGGSTNLQATFDLLLATAVTNRVPVSDMPTTVVVVSDMEFNATDRGFETNLGAIKRKYADAGYTCPRLVFWNVNARNDQSPITVKDSGVVLVSGHSPSTFKNLLANKTMDALSIMLDVINGDRYSGVVV